MLDCRHINVRLKEFDFLLCTLWAAIFIWTFHFRPCFSCLLFLLSGVTWNDTNSYITYTQLSTDFLQSSEVMDTHLSSPYWRWSHSLCFQSAFPSGQPQTEPSLCQDVWCACRPAGNRPLADWLWCHVHSTECGSIYCSCYSTHRNYRYP